MKGNNNIATNSPLTDDLHYLIIRILFFRKNVLFICYFEVASCAIDNNNDNNNPKV